MFVALGTALVGEMMVASEDADVPLPLGADEAFAVVDVTLLETAALDVWSEVAALDALSELVPGGVVIVEAGALSDVEEEADVEVLVEEDAADVATGVTTMEVGGVPDDAAAFLIVKSWLQLPVSPSTVGEQSDVSVLARAAEGTWVRDAYAQ